VPRLFAGTPWDRPPTCDRCGRLESECSCSPPVVEMKQVPPQQQTARLTTERRAKGKLVTVVAGLSAQDNDLNELATRLKNACGAGGTVKDGQIELQGDHVQAAERTLQTIGYQTKASDGGKLRR
jgi:translation initiation factor 1